MSMNHALFDEELAANVALAGDVSGCIVLIGRRQFDRFLLANDDTPDSPRVLSLERLVHQQLEAQATWTYDPAGQRVLLAHADELVEMQTPMPLQEGAETSLSLPEALQAWKSLPTGAKPRYAMIVDASLLFQDPASPRDLDFEVLRALEGHARTGDRQHLLLLRADRTTALPSTLLSSPQVRVVHIRGASRDVRRAYANSRCVALAKQFRQPLDEVAQSLASATEDWTLDQIDALVRTAERQDLSALQDLQELARAVRIGTTYSPWAGKIVHNSVASAQEDLTRRVIGQPKAVDAVYTALRASVVGLTGAHQGPGSQAPRATLFFAGPTGTGKTEMAKAISQLVFGEEKLLRFDCGELQESHAVARLVGAPPGFVGHDRGGELTDGIRAKPNSVVLFDEIEKAHPRLLDTLLGVLDDGRLTSGQGETAYFGQAVLIFTSNLGMYENLRIDETHSTRRARFEYDTPFETIEAKVRRAIGDEFVTQLGRPELLGRFGGPSRIIVFDYLRELAHVCGKFVGNIATAAQFLHNVQLQVDDAVIEQVVQATRNSPDALVLGGRGLHTELKRFLSEPLDEYLFANPDFSGVLRASWDGDQTIFETHE